jgi:predicted SAM-dependent methyltransferase
MKLHLGCGKLRLDDFINIDILSKSADLKLNVSNLSIINDSKVEDIYVSHCLEHFKRNEIIDLLLEWNRVLKIDGFLRIAVPDFEKVVKIYLKNKDMSELIGFLSGGQKDNFDIHYVNFDINILTKLLNICGFDNIKRYDELDFLKDKDDYSSSYIPHMDIENGELMSLNIICKKTQNVDINNIILCDQIKKFTKLY